MTVTGSKPRAGQLPGTSGADSAGQRERRTPRPAEAMTGPGTVPSRTSSRPRRRCSAARRGARVRLVGRDAITARTSPGAGHRRPRLPRQRRGSDALGRRAGPTGAQGHARRIVPDVHAEPALPTAPLAARWQVAPCRCAGTCRGRTCAPICSSPAPRRHAARTREPPTTGRCRPVTGSNGTSCGSGAVPRREGRSGVLCFLDDRV